MDTAIVDELSEALAMVSAGMRKENGGDNGKDNDKISDDNVVDDVESIENGIIIDDEGISDVSHLRNGIVINPSKVESWAKDWALGCVNSPPAARGIQEAGFTQHMARLLADPCT